MAIYTRFCHVKFEISRTNESAFVVLYSKVIPAMALTVGCLGEKLRAISKEANLSAASLAAYLNEVWSYRFFSYIIQIKLF